MNRFSKFGLAAFSAIAFSMTASGVSAFQVFDQAYDPTGSTPVPPADYPVSKTFRSTSATLNYGSLSVTCTLTLNGEVDEIAPGIGQVRVVSGNVSGGSGIGIFVCPTISLGGFPWLSDDVPVADAQVYGSSSPDPINLTFRNIGVNLCSPSSGLIIDATFSNNNPAGIPFGSTSEFGFPSPGQLRYIDGSGNEQNSNCAFSGNLTPHPVSGNDIEIYQ